jgi:hypothetical protein
MKKLLLAVLFACIIIFLIGRCSSDKPQTTSTEDSLAVENTIASGSTGSEANNPYHMMHVVFKGSPEQDQIQALVESIMDMYKMPKTDETALKIGNVATTLSKKSATGFTEMELLKHVYQQGSSLLTFADQAAQSSVVLDKSR